MPNGAHHSDLSHDLPGPQDTADVTEVRQQAAAILARWLASRPSPTRAEPPAEEVDEIGRVAEVVGVGQNFCLPDSSSILFPSVLFVIASMRADISPYGLVHH